VTAISFAVTARYTRDVLGAAAGLRRFSTARAPARREQGLTGAAAGLTAVEACHLDLLGRRGQPALDSSLSARSAGAGAAPPARLREAALAAAGSVRRPAPGTPRQLVGADPNARAQALLDEGVDDGDPQGELVEVGRGEAVRRQRVATAASPPARSQPGAGRADVDVEAVQRARASRSRKLQLEPDPRSSSRVPKSSTDSPAPASRAARARRGAGRSADRRGADGRGDLVDGLGRFRAVEQNEGDQDRWRASRLL